jgi:hypothetical protein
MRVLRNIVIAVLLSGIMMFSISSARAVDSGYNALPSYAQGETDDSKYPPGFAEFWKKLQSAVIRGSIVDAAQLTIFPFGSPCDRSRVKFTDFVNRFHEQMQMTVMVKDPRDSRTSDYVQMSLFNLIVSSPLDHPEFHYYSDKRVSLNRLEFRVILSRWYWACW